MKSCQKLINRTNRARNSTNLMRSNDEVMWKDEFFNPYIGRIYDGGDTEVLSMGIQSLYEPSYFRQIIRNDPDHFRLIWATLRGY